MNFIQRIFEPQMVAGYLSAMSDFSHEFMGGDFNKVELFSGEKLVVYEDPGTKLKIAALTNSLDNTTLLRKLIITILHKFEELNIGHTKNGSFNFVVKEHARELETFIRNLLKKNTARRDKKISFVSFLIASLTLISFLIFTSEFFVMLISLSLNALQTVFLMVPLNFNPFDPINANYTLSILVLMIGVFMLLQVYINVGLIASAYFYGYLVGSRKNPVKRGSLLILVELPTVCIMLYVIRNVYIVVFFLISFSLFVFLPILCASYCYYLGGMAREKRRLQDIPEGRKFRKIVAAPDNF